MYRLGIAFAMAAALLISGLLSWKAEATTGAGALAGMVKHYSLIQKAACGGVWGKHCPPGYVWTCRPGRCWCAKC
jgi:hypothetical protein